jgi:hypothetical protein
MVGKIRSDFSNVNKHTFQSRRDGGIFGQKIYSMDFVLEVRFGDETGLLVVESIVGGKVRGKTSINFD